MSFDFLAALEAKVNEAARRLEELEQENQRLEHEVARLAALDSPPPPPPPPAQGAKADKPDRNEKAWVKERDEIRRRLESLIARLEALLP